MQNLTMYCLTINEDHLNPIKKSDFFIKLLFLQGIWLNAHSKKYKKSKCQKLSMM